jgi:FkbM family methyltransferase
MLKRHIDLNHSTNVRIIQAAASDREGEASFMLGSSNATGCLASMGEVTVKVVTIDSLVAAGAIPSPDVMKIDVEGAAAGVLAGAEYTLKARRPVIFLALHGTAESEGCSRLLSRLKYDERVIDAMGGDTMWTPA